MKWFMKFLKQHELIEELMQELQFHKDCKSHIIDSLGLLYTVHFGDRGIKAIHQSICTGFKAVYLLSVGNNENVHCPNWVGFF